MRDYASLLVARRMLSSGACVAVLRLGGCEWPLFLSMRWHLAAALVTDPAPLAAGLLDLLAVLRLHPVATHRAHLHSSFTLSKLTTYIQGVRCQNAYLQKSVRI